MKSILLVQALEGVHKKQGDGAFFRAAEVTPDGMSHTACRALLRSEKFRVSLATNHDLLLGDEDGGLAYSLSRVKRSSGESVGRKSFTKKFEQHTTSWDETDPWKDSPQPYDHRPGGWGENCRLVSTNVIVFDVFGEKRFRFFWTWEREVP